MKAILVLACIAVNLSSIFATEQSSVSRHGFTWTFDQNYECGQYVNGDWWVIGPVNITAISPAYTGAYNGSMVNPSEMRAIQGYDSRMPGTTFNEALRVAAPVTLQPKSSLISTQSYADAGARPLMKAAAVLTVVAAQPPADAFRPPYIGTAKPEYRTSQLQRHLLPNLTAVTGVLNIGTVAAGFERIWLEHYSHGGDGTQYTSPTDNMPGYGREYSTAINDAALMLMLDEDWLQTNQGQGKEKLLIRFVQLGIDLYENVEYGGNWPANGGLNHGRKWPILLSGILLNHTGMKTIGTRSFTHSSYDEFRGFHEDCQTYTDTSGNMTWGIRNCNPSKASEKYNYTSGYRLCCTSHTWTGIALTARMMYAADGTSAYDLWNWPSFFGYVDHWTKEQGETTPSTYPNIFTVFMWRAYRNNLPGPVGIRNNDTQLEGKIHRPNVTAMPNPMIDRLIFTGSNGAVNRGSVLTIFNQTGTMVYSINRDKSSSALTWNGTTSTGQTAVPGLYFYRITDGTVTNSGQILKVQ